MTIISALYFGKLVVVIAPLTRARERHVFGTQRVG